MWLGSLSFPINFYGVCARLGSLTPKSIYLTRFMSIGEQMGRILQRTAISTNIKTGVLKLFGAPLDGT